MSAHPPPVPPEQRPKHGGDASRADLSQTGAQPGRDSNTAEQGQAGNTKQNTTNKGLQQDR